MILGPVWSKSAGQETQYTVSYYHMKLKHLPALEKLLVPHTPNVLLKRSDLSKGRGPAVSRPVRALEEAISGGIEALPFSWGDDLPVDIVRDVAKAY